MEEKKKKKLELKTIKIKSLGDNSNKNIFGGTIGTGCQTETTVTTDTATMGLPTFGYSEGAECVSAFDCDGNEMTWFYCDGDETFDACQEGSIDNWCDTCLGCDAENTETIYDNNNFGETDTCGYA